MSANRGSSAAKQVQQLLKEIEACGFRVTQGKHSYKVLAPVRYGKGVPAKYFPISPSDYRAIKNNRAWAERYGLPKKKHCS